MRSLISYVKFGIAAVLLTAICTVAMAEVFNPGDKVEVYNTQGMGLLVRNAPKKGARIGRKYDREVGMVLEGPIYADGYNRWKIRWSDGLEGWSAQDWLRKKNFSPSTKFSIGDRVEVYNTASYGLRVRTDPPELAKMGKVYDGTTGMIKGGPFYGVPKGSSGFYWFWKVKFDSGITGWATEDYLRRATPVISAEIISYSPSTKIRVNLGRSFPLSFTFKNTGNKSWDFWGGYSIWDSKGKLVDSKWSSSSKRVSPNQKESFQWRTSLNTPGEYWLQFGIWKYRERDLLDKKPRPSQNLITVSVLPPMIRSISPNPVTGSNSKQRIIISGASFISGATVTWRDLTFNKRYPERGPISLTSTQIVIKATFGNDPSNWTVQVVNPDGQSSNQFRFSVVAPFPVISSLEPSSRVAGGSAFELKVKGNTFHRTSVVLWNGSKRLTRPDLDAVGRTVALRASIFASDIASPGQASITVYSPGPGGGMSSPVTFTIEPPSRVLTITKLEPLKISTDIAPYDTLLSLTGTNFLNVKQVKFTWSGAASGSVTWDKGDSDWNTKVRIDSDTYMTLWPRVVESSPTWFGTVNWKVTLVDINGMTASKSFTVIYNPPIADSWRFPLDGDWTITQNFASPNKTWGGYHLGEDVKRDYEAPVYAPANGIVKHNYKRTYYGYVVIIEHKLPDGNYVCSVLGHLRREGRVDVGTVVNKGQLVGYLSRIPEETGYTFIHLHFGIRGGRHSEELDPDGKWRYRGYGPGYIADLWYRPSHFIKTQGIPSNSTRFKPDDYVEVKWGTLNLRENYGLGAKIKIRLSKGEKGRVIPHPDNGKYRGGYWWWHVRFGGEKGWGAEAGLRRIEPPKPQIERILSVPYYDQGNTKWCVPTSMAMIFKYFGKNIHSWDIAKYWHLGKEDALGWWFEMDDKIIQYFSDHELSAKKISDADNFDVIRSQIDSKNPVMLLMFRIRHAVVVVGYSSDADSKKVYINDPGQELLSELGLPLRPSIAVPIDWKDVAKYAGGLSYIISVGGKDPSPPKGTIDIGATDGAAWNGGFYFSYKGRPPQLYGWMYGLDKGLDWNHSEDHPLSLNEKDQFQFGGAIVNHTKSRQTYKLEIEFTSKDFSPEPKIFSVTVDAKSSQGDVNEPIIKDPIPLRDYLKDKSGEYTITLSLWNSDLTEKYDEIVLPPIEYKTQPVISNVADIIRKEAIETVEVTVNEQQYMIVSLGKYIDPETLDPLDVNYIPIVYTDARYNPISDTKLIKKVYLIYITRNLQKIMPSVIRDWKKAKRGRLKVHGLYKLADLFGEVGERALAIAVGTYLSGGAAQLSSPEWIKQFKELTPAILHASENITKDLITDPLTILEVAIYKDFEEAEANFDSLLQIRDINSYGVAHDYIDHNLRAWALGGATSAAWDVLDKIDEIGEPTYERIIHQLAKVGLGTLTKIANLEVLEDYVKVAMSLPLVSDYVRKKLAAYKDYRTYIANLTNPEHMPATGKYTLTLAKRLTQRPSLPDITVSKVTFKSTFSDPTFVEPGSNLSVSFTIENKTDVPINSFVCQIFLADDKGVSIPLGDYKVKETVVKGFPYSRSVILHVPNDIGPGEYYIGLRSDAFNFVDEANETNNTRKSSKVLKIGSPPRPDLTVAKVSAPSSARVGKIIPVSFTLINQGRVSSRAFTVRISLSTNPYGTEILLEQFRVNSLTGSERIDRNIALPSVPSGDYYLTVYADAFRDIAETREDNNINKASNKIHIKSVFTISGKVKYFLDNKSIPDVQLSLSGDTSLTVSSNTDGTYLFSNIEGGNYIVTPSKTTDLGGVNATDALKVVRHTAGIEVLKDPNQLIAGDVNNDGRVNATDALKIVRYAAGLGPLPSGNWKFIPSSRSYSPLNSDMTSQDYIGIRMGDVNGSWTLGSGASKVASSKGEISLAVPDLSGVAGENLRVPLRFHGRRTIGAMTILLSYLPDLLLYEGLEGLFSDLMPVVGDKDGVLRIIWVDMTGSTPVQFDSGSKLVLKFKALKAGCGSVDLLSGTELADSSGRVIPVEVKGGFISIENRPKHYRLSQNFPNPFNTRTSIRYSLPKDSYIDLSIYDITGGKVVTLVNGNQSAGIRTVVWDGRDEEGREVSSGIYLYQLSTEEFTKVRKMILLR